MIDLIVGASLKGTFVLGLAWLAALAARKASADLRHKIWLGALVAMAALMIPVPMVEPARLSTLAAGVAQAGVSHRMGSTSWTTWAVRIWAAGVLAVAARQLAGTIRLAQITKAAQLDLLGILLSDQVKTPLTWGALNPVVLLPKYALEWTPDKRNWAIRHERAHIARRDWLWQSFGRAMTCVFWFHPLVWLAAARLRNEAEHAADDAVLVDGADAPGYAAQLVEVARMLNSEGVLAGVSMVRTPVLENRVTAILNSAQARRPLGRAGLLGIVAAMLCLLLPLAAYQSEPAHKMGEPGLSGPQVLTKLEPAYTQEAKDAKIEGTVVLSLVVNAEGRAEDFTIVRGLGAGLDESAMTAIRQWTFRPGMKDGMPVPVMATIEVNFKLL